MKRHILPPLQRAVFEYIAARISKTGKSPSYQEMAKHFGYVSTGCITSPVIQLEKKGYLARARGRHLAMRVLRMPEGSAIDWLNRRVASEAKAETAASP